MTDYEGLRGRIEAARRKAMSESDKGPMWNAGVRILDDPEDVVAEASLAKSGFEGNYGVPATGEVCKAAMKRMESRGLTPAWEVVDGIK